MTKSRCAICTKTWDEHKTIITHDFKHDPRSSKTDVELRRYVHTAGFMMNDAAGPWVSHHDAMEVIERLRPAAESWESYVAAEERKAAMRQDEAQPAALNDVLEILREVSTLDCFHTGASCPPDCQCLSAKAGRAIYAVAPDETTDRIGAGMRPAPDADCRCSACEMLRRMRSERPRETSARFPLVPQRKPSDWIIQPSFLHKVKEAIDAVPEHYDLDMEEKRFADLRKILRAPLEPKSNQNDGCDLLDRNNDGKTIDSHRELGVLAWLMVRECERVGVDTVTMSRTRDALRRLGHHQPPGGLPEEPLCHHLPAQAQWCSRCNPEKASAPQPGDVLGTASMVYTGKLPPRKLNDENGDGA